MVLTVILASIAVLIGIMIWLRKSAMMQNWSHPDPGVRRRARTRVGLVLTGAVLLPITAIVALVFVEEWLYFERIEARVEGTETVCTVATLSRRKGRDRWEDRTEAMPCADAQAQRQSISEDARVVQKERINYVYSDPAGGSERRGFVIYSDPPSPFRAGQRISVLHPKSGDVSGRRPQAL